MKTNISKIAISEALVMVLVVMLLTAYLNFAEGAAPDAPLETPSVGETVIRDTEPLGGTTAEGAVEVKPPVEVTQDGKVAAGSTDVTKTEEKLEDEMEAAPQ